MRDIAVTAVIFGLLPACLFRPWIGILVWYWFGMMNPHRLTFGFSQSIPFAMAIAAAILMGAPFAKDRRPIPWNIGLFLMVLLLCYFAGTNFFAWYPEAAWEKWNQVMKIILMTLVASMFIYGHSRIRALLLTVSLSIGFYGVKGGIWTLLTGGVNRVEGPEATFIGGNTFLGLAMVMVLPMLVNLARTEKNRPWLAKFLAATAALTALSTVFTYSRGALLGLGVLIPLLFLKSDKKFIIILLALPLLYFAKSFVPESIYKRAETIQSYQEDRSAMQRIRTWKVAWRVASESPFKGGGFEYENYPDPSRWFSYVDEELLYLGDKVHDAHSIYFEVMGQQGLVAFGLFIAMLLITILQLARIAAAAKRAPDFEWIASYADAIRFGLIGYMVSGAFLSAGYFDLMYICIALTAILKREAANVPKEESSTASPSREQRSFIRKPLRAT